jgi:hypothetical protein
MAVSCSKDKQCEQGEKIAQSYIDACEQYRAELLSEKITMPQYNNKVEYTKQQTLQKLSGKSNEANTCYSKYLEAHRESH